MKREGHEVIPLNLSNELTVDITDIEQATWVLKREKPDVVYHLAGTVLNVARKHPFLSVRLDILGTSNIIEACIQSRVQRMVYASSFYVFDGLSDKLVVDEETQLNPLGAEWFGTAKIVGEKLIMNQAGKLPYTIVRFGAAYGAHPRCSCVVYDFIKHGLEGKDLVVWGEGTRRNQYTFVGDLADGCVKVLDAKENQVFNLISPEQTSTHKLAQLLRQKYGFKVNYNLEKGEGPSMPYMSSKKAQTVIGWNPTSLEDGIEKVAEDVKQTL